MDKIITSVLFIVSFVAIAVSAFDKPLTLVAFVALWWAIIKIGIWMTKDRDAKEESRRSRNTPL